MRKYILIILLVLLVDQSSKVWVKTHMHMDESIPIFGWEKAQIYFTENPGMAFGFELEGEYGKLMLSLFRIIAVAGIGWYLWDLYKKKASPGYITCIALIFAGALGNIIDSAFYGLIFSESDRWLRNVAEFMPEGGGYAGFLHGHVVDMFYFPLWRGTFPEWFPIWGGEDFEFFRPVFNVSDAAITVGVICILLFQRRFFPKKMEPSVGAQDDGTITPTPSPQDTPRSEPHL